MKSLSTIVFLLFFTIPFYGQRIIGTITDAKNDTPIAGVNVFIKSIKKGVTSKNNGIFYFEQAKGVEKNDTILFNMVGYNTLKLTLEEYEKKDKKIKLQEENLVTPRTLKSSGKIITLGSSNHRIE